jgi:glucan phosphoethanolaminetransferase (alkaline phosphatase superfamily)
MGKKNHLTDLYTKTPARLMAVVSQKFLWALVIRLALISALICWLNFCKDRFCSSIITLKLVNDALALVNSCCV